MAAAFVVLGVFWGTWAVAVADVQHTFSLSDLQLGLLLSVAVAVAGLAGAFFSHRAERHGAGPMLTASLAVWAALLVAAGLAPGLPLFVLCFVAAEVGAGSVDTAMNAAANQRLLGRPAALVRFHSLFNCGALCGAAAAGVLLHAGLSWRVLWPGLALVVGALALWSARTPRAAPVTPATVPAGPAPGGSGPMARLRADGLATFLLIFAVAELTEGGVDTWGVLYLRTHLAAGVLLGAGAYVVGQSVAASTRWAGAPALGRLSAPLALLVGGLVAATGILVESLSPLVGLAAVGLALGAGGASLFWPLVMSEVTAQSSAPTAAAGAFTAAGYVGWVAGAPLIGAVSDRDPARGLQLLAALALLVAGAGAVRALQGRRPSAVGE